MTRLIVMLICLVSTPVISGLYAQTDTTVTVIPESEIDTTIYDQVDIDDESEEEINYFLSLSPSDTLVPHRKRTPAAEIDQLKKDKAFWYANRQFKEEEPEDYSANTGRGTSITSRPWFSTLMWIIIVVVFIAVIILYLNETQLGLFRRNRVIDTGAEEPVEDMPEDIFAISYQKEIDKAVASGDYRLAVRLHYLRLLKSFAERGLIRYQHDKTNMEYLMQLYKSPVYDAFFSVTRHYEYTWYGGFPVSADAYEWIRKDFEKTENY